MKHPSVHTQAESELDALRNSTMAEDASLEAVRQGTKKEQHRAGDLADRIARVILPYLPKLNDSR